VVGRARYILSSPALSTVLLRLAAVAFGGSAIMALLPLVTHKLLHGGALTYGVLLGCFGFGAVMGGWQLGRLRRNFSDEILLRNNSLLLGASLAVMAFSRNALLTAAVLNTAT
jgi:predicted MFS family arabinose efflux permease